MTRLLVEVLRSPERAVGLGTAEWSALVTAARAELLAGALAHRVTGLPVPERIAGILDAARDAAAESRRTALWEAEMARRTLTAAGLDAILLKGAAYVAAGLDAGRGRHIGDLDILVPRARLVGAEHALLSAGWESVKPDPYDDAYYRRWMHELPPLIHKSRDHLIDVHHTILPLTAGITPDAEALVADAVPLRPGLATLSPEDMVVHAALHLFADGDLSGGLRNLWDVDRLVREFVAEDAQYLNRLIDRATRHGAARTVARAMRIATHLYAAPGGDPLRVSDRPYVRRLLARDGWGRATRPVTRFAFYVRSHAIRMPPRLLARHLWVKARRARTAPPRS